MADRLTDEHIHNITEFGWYGNAEEAVSMASELVALRYKLEKVGSILNEWSRHPVVRMITKEIAGK